MLVLLKVMHLLPKDELKRSKQGLHEGPTYSPRISTIKGFCEISYFRQSNQILKLNAQKILKSNFLVGRKPVILEHVSFQAKVLAVLGIKLGFLKIKLRFLQSFHIVRILVLLPPVTLFFLFQGLTVRYVRVSKFGYTR